MQDFQNHLKYYQNVENCSIFLNVTFHIWKSCVWGPEKANLAICNNNKTTDFQKWCENIEQFSTDSESPAFKFFKTGLTYAFILAEKFKNQQNFRIFFAPKTVYWKKIVLGSIHTENWLMARIFDKSLESVPKSWPFLLSFSDSYRSLSWNWGKKVVFSEKIANQLDFISFFKLTFWLKLWENPTRQHFSPLFEFREQH